MDKHIRVKIYALLEEYRPGGLETGPNDVDLTIVKQHRVCPLGKTLPARREVFSLKPRTKRLDFTLSSCAFGKIEALAKKHKISVAEVVRICVQLITEPGSVAEEYRAIKEQLKTPEFSRVLDEVEVLAKKRK